ncbi:MAG: DinB family protein [Armatimonadota bacterium]
MSRALMELLTRQMDNAWAGLREALEGLTEEEYHWRPSPDALTFDVLLPPDDEEDPHAYWGKMPFAFPSSTIEYKVAHVATCKIMYVEYAFGEGRLRWRWSDFNVPKTLATMRPYLERAHATLRRSVEGLADSDLAVMRKTNWGEFWPTEWILWVMISHDIYHGAQIRTIRTFYRAAAQAGEGGRETSRLGEPHGNSTD